MFSQFFGNYLLENQKINAEQYSSCMDYISKNRVKLGLLAENEGLLTRGQATELNYYQMQTDKRFGDLAVEKGYLTEADLSYLLEQQGNPYLIYIQALEENNILSRDEIDSCLASFQQENNFSDSIMKAIETGNVTKLLPAFVDTEDKRYLDIIGLALRNIIRFISSYIRIQKGYFSSGLSAKYVASQHTSGDYNGFLGFCSDNDDILVIADGYAKESFGTVDEDALDSVCEFTNCINGLYASELSYHNVKIDMLPPEVHFDETISGDNYYVLPLYIENKHVNLIVKIG